MAAPTWPRRGLGPWRLRILAALLLALSVTGALHAHVGVLPAVVPPATNLAFTVRVPNEKPEPTVRVRVEFPSNLTVSRFQPKAGWKRELERDGAGRIVAATWSGGEIGADEYEDFTFVARTPGEPGVLMFKAYQTYQGGETVEWVNPEGEDNPAAFVTVAEGVAPAAESGSAPIEETSPVGAASDTGQTTAPAEPAGTTIPVAPVVTTAPAGAGNLAEGDLGVEPAGVGETATISAAETGSDLPLFTSLAALVVGLIALALAVVALFRRREV